MNLSIFKDKRIIFLVMSVFLLTSFFPFRSYAATGESVPDNPFDSSLPYSIGRNVPAISQDLVNIMLDSADFNRNSQYYFIVQTQPIRENSNVQYNLYIFDSASPSISFLWGSTSQNQVVPDNAKPTSFVDNNRLLKWARDINILSSGLKFTVNSNFVKRTYFSITPAGTVGYQANYPGAGSAQNQPIFGHPSEPSYYPVASNFNPTFSYVIGDTNFSQSFFGNDLEDSSEIDFTFKDWLDKYGDGSLSLEDITSGEAEEASTGSMLGAIYNRLGKVNNNILSGFASLIKYFSDKEEAEEQDKNVFFGILEEIKQNIASLHGGLSQASGQISAIYSFITKPVTSSDVQGHIQELYPYQLFIMQRDTMQSLINNMNGISPPDELVYIFDFTQSNNNIISSFGVCKLDFSWYKPIREHYINWFIFLIILDFVLCIFAALPDIIHGFSGGKSND